ncbi:hypothetical protein A3B51_00515 [Candidatus Curtissbacteria bacterium RIFCSPLOWO2_01_FULL_41_18]|uniref:alanine--tRNA ligase n=1 Tax=Candidatus Curtissbacteria bacterium RIFCSPLOWO2_01_FULL_41_18 TaxID=1797727 RepID=A0A1F5HLQ4_9BACT|nr:MAG: hypothetical protein A3B51_00515 [Candidatus Curtissbacteria bacterium RIFCSPLOWO2_01_FULL_41_18]
MNSVELRQKYLKFFESRGHKIISSASLVPDELVELSGTQRVLFTTAGMHPLVPYLLGAPHLEGQRLTNIQRCLRTDDIDQVGDAVHNTFFEMLGNWSLGDPASPDGVGLGGYWKKETITWSYEFLVNELKLDPKRIYVSVFAGDKDAPFDEESFNIWVKLGMPKDRIFKYPKKDNWWGPVGETGPCGPDTEMFYDMDPKAAGPIDPSSDSNRFVEIWNDVFMQYDRKIKNEKLKMKNDSNASSVNYYYVPLKQKNVDTGMGMERMLMVLQNAPSVYETDVFLPLIKFLEKEVFVKFKYGREERVDKAFRITADHLRAAVFLINDGLKPGNKERQYVLRRLIRRAVLQKELWGEKKSKLGKVVSVVEGVYKGSYNFSVTNISNIIDEETRKAEVAVGAAMKIWRKIVETSGGPVFIPGRSLWGVGESVKRTFDAKIVFDLYQNYGLPIEITAELAREVGGKIDRGGALELFKKHQESSRKASQKTKGGLVVQTEQAAKLHTATHLLHQALRDILGHHVHQTGSHITEERLRFDFSHNEKLSDDQIKKVEESVNQKIKENLTVYKKTMPREEADRLGAIGLFDEKYGDLVNIYYIAGTEDMKSAFSKEFCGGPHATSTSELKSFNIIKEESAGSGIRRIYATISG